MKLRKYWFKFEPLGRPDSLNLGCGVTAYNYDDALIILRERVFCSEPIPRIQKVFEDIDISTLDPGHVLPNMEVPIYRGVWFPKGYN